MPRFSKKIKDLPDSIRSLIEHAVKNISPSEVLLFGSRARGDFRENSDFDIAIKKQNLDPKDWARLLVDLDEEPYTLFQVDLVHFENMPEEYQKNIIKEGILLYG